MIDPINTADALPESPGVYWVKTAPGAWGPAYFDPAIPAASAHWRATVAAWVGPLPTD